MTQSPFSKSIACLLTTTSLVLLGSHQLAKADPLQTPHTHPAIQTASDDIAFNDSGLALTQSLQNVRSPPC